MEPANHDQVPAMKQRAERGETMLTFLNTWAAAAWAARALSPVLLVALLGHLGAAPALAERGAQGFYGVSLGMTKAEVMALGLGLIDADPEGFDGQQFYQFETGDPDKTFHVTFEGAEPEVVYMEVDLVDRTRPTPVPSLGGEDRGQDAPAFELGRSALGEIDKAQPSDGFYFACRPFDIVDDTIILTTAYPIAEGVNVIYFTELSPLHVLSGAVDPAFEAISQSVLMGVAITRTDYTDRHWCKEVRRASPRPPLPQILIDRLEWGTTLLELPGGDPRRAWVAETSHWAYFPEFDVIRKHGNIVHGDQMTLQFNDDCTAADIVLLLAIPGTKPIPFEQGERIAAEFGIISDRGFNLLADGMEVIAILPYEPEDGGVPLSLLIVGVGSMDLAWLQRLPRGLGLWGFQIVHGEDGLFQSNTNAWDFLALTPALREAVAACRAR
jgi:hypothetical protein